MKQMRVRDCHHPVFMCFDYTCAHVYVHVVHVCRPSNTVVDNDRGMSHIRVNSHVPEIDYFLMVKQNATQTLAESFYC